MYCSTNTLPVHRLGVWFRTCVERYQLLLRRLVRPCSLIDVDPQATGQACVSRQGTPAELSKFRSQSVAKLEPTTVYAVRGLMFQRIIFSSRSQRSCRGISLWFSIDTPRLKFVNIFFSLLIFNTIHFQSLSTPAAQSGQTSRIKVDPQTS